MLIYIIDYPIVSDWTWDDGAPVDYETWQEGEPNDSNQGEDCVTVQSIEPDPDNGIHAGGWNDDNCQNSYSFVCELFLGDSPWNLNNIEYPATGGCKQGWLPFGGNCFNFGNTVPGDRYKYNINMFYVLNYFN